MMIDERDLHRPTSTFTFWAPVKAFIAAHFVSWIIEIAILSVIAVITIGEVRQTNEQTRQMLTAISEFVGERKEAVGNAIDSIAGEAQNIELGGKVDAGEAAEDAMDAFKIWLKKDKGE